MTVTKNSSAGKSRRATSRKATVSKIEKSVVGRPIVIANKTFLAGLGLVATVQSEFGSAFAKLASDGEKVRDQYESSITSWRKDVVKQVKAAQKRVVKNVKSNVKSVAETMAEISPVATQYDVDKLNSKLDKVLAQVAK